MGGPNDKPLPCGGLRASATSPTTLTSTVSPRRSKTNAMRQDIDVQGLWQSAFREARFDLRSYGQDITIPPKSPCPFELDDLLVDEFDSEAALARIEPLIPSRAD